MNISHRQIMRDPPASSEKGDGSLGREVMISVGNAFDSLRGKYGFDYYMLSSFPRADKAGFSDNMLLCNWPVATVAAYDKTDVFRRCLLMTRLKKTIMPLWLSGPSIWFDVDGRDYAHLALAFPSTGFEHAVSFTLHDAHMNVYVVAFCGARDAIRNDELSDIHFSAMQALDEGTVAASMQQGPQEGLTAREIECLRWSAAGKSSDEIGIILAISSHTVISYLKSAMRKLDAVNRMQAIARAYRYRLL